jgi:hypothetical protein
MNRLLFRSAATGALSALLVAPGIAFAIQAATPPAPPPARPAQPAANPNLTTAPSRGAAQTAPGGQQVGAADDGEEDQAPPLVLDPPVCDFGFVSPSASPTKKIKLKNTSDKPLTILAIQPSCKCTTVNDLVGEEIPAGGFLELEASMKATSAPGPKKAEIKILIDGFSRVVNLQMMQEITLAVRAAPGYINAVKGQPQSGRFVLESIDKKPFSVCAVHGRAPAFVGFDPAKDPPQNQYVLEYDVNSFPVGRKPRYLVIETDHPEAPLVDIFFRIEESFPKPVLKMQEYRLALGKVEQGTPGEFLLDIGELPADEPVVSVATTYPGARVEMLETTKEGIFTKIKCRFTPPPEFTGLMYAPISIFTTRRQQDMGVFGMYTPKGHTGCLGPMEMGEGWSMVWKPTGPKSTAAATPAAAAPAAPTTLGTSAPASGR